MRRQLTWRITFGNLPGVDIKTYIRRHNLTQRDFGRLVGVEQPLVSQWVGRKKPVSAERAVQIEKRTGGAISRRDLRPDLFDKAA